jgi:predicted GNAT superfamily acetyltransferase
VNTANTDLLLDPERPVAKAEFERALEVGQGLVVTLHQPVQMAAKDGRHVVRAVTAPVNSTSIAFHAAMGFTVTGPVDGYDGPSSVKVLFERRLSA